ncbi:hypothetical protein F4782DRAFT_548750 [Xylaria castorea]|nr:hypothetical protein F4782DRAFT_548750 [Xylaria castorea]
MGDGLTAPTSDKTAGIGAEFETRDFHLTMPGCSKANTDAAKRKIIAGRAGTNFQLTADTGSQAGVLTPEYIMRGDLIKVGSGSAAAKAGAAAAADLMAWWPWNPDGTPRSDTNNIQVADSPCNPWSVIRISKGVTPENVVWDAQITAPIPLEALYYLMGQAHNNAQPSDRNILSGDELLRAGNPTGPNLVFVTKDYFASLPNGIRPADVTDDILGFCSLVLTYAKGAKYTLHPDQSPKLLFQFMPRTEFNTIFQQVKTKMPGGLFAIFNILACYKLQDKKLVIDRDYCTGSLAMPVPNQEFGKLTYKNSAPGPEPRPSVNVKAWIDGIGSGTGVKDALSVFDESIDGSIGGLGTAIEKMYNSQRAVPLFEFRDLIARMPKTSEFESFMGTADTAVQTLHRDFATVPRRKKRYIPANCFLAAASAMTSSATAVTST